VQVCKEVIKRRSLFDFESAELIRFFRYVSGFFIRRRHRSSKLGHPNLHLRFVKTTLIDEVCLAIVKIQTGEILSVFTERMPFHRVLEKENYN